MMHKDTVILLRKSVSRWSSE